MITPSLLQKIELLTLTHQELLEMIQEELASNPVLEEGAVQQLAQAVNETPKNGSEDGSGAVDESDPEYYFKLSEYLAPSQRRLDYEVPDQGPTFEAFLAEAPTLSEHLLSQLNLLEIDEEEYEIAYYIIGNINGDGYLMAKLSEIALALEVEVERVEETLKVVQALDPTGVGCRSLQECLLLQMPEVGLEGSLAERLVRDFSEDLENRRYKEIMRRLRCSLEDIGEAVEQIRHLNPRPGQKFNSTEPVYIQPDVYIYKTEDGFQISLADEGMPRLRLSSTYRQLLRDSSTSKETKSFIRERMRAAIDLLKSVDQRHQTIFRVCEAIVRRQPDFLEKGILFLKPMLIKDIAEELEVHSSTISRVVSNKYAHTPQGIVELRKFFTVGVEGADGENVSTIQVKERIRRIIEQENRDKPLSDQKISRMLNKDGIQITRRTVAKYRDQMNILGSRERKLAVALPGPI